MADGVRLSTGDFRKVYEHSFKTWSALYHHAAVEQPGLPLTYLDIRDAFPHHPAFPRDLQLKHVYATGRSSWGSNQPDCEQGLPSFHREVQIGVVSRDSTPLSVAAPSERGEIRWEVRLHAACEGHGLRYRGIAWDCVDGRTTATHGLLDGADTPLAIRQSPGSSHTVPIDYRRLDMDRASASENATRSVIGWLRVDGFAVDENEMSRHEWVEFPESDEEDEGGSEDSSGTMPTSSSYFDSWVSEVVSETANTVEVV
ncbi:hypothetical protein N658DRAFT_482046 [Parathielavia hyrcaniae]|uniref:Uncharacterized protein n=1 Tax=Parathielavia hyrcaniae TaxID=113614 RepID=A0AAN6Q9G9_9PEZI|nr:hypothetical protein N658DRAFT_482046 [Parathielavia hyrcaniae]